MESPTQEALYGDPLDPNQDLTRTLGQPAHRPAGARFDSRAIPARIGNYRIIRLLGEGGMGVVYEAVQDHPMRAVALKVIRSSWASPTLLQRFERESEALARLQHPGIAQVYESGTADSAGGPQPFFAMEFIAEGQPLTQYAEAERLSTEQRLRMIAEVCDAVQHAHQRGIIHRDLKPSNILVDGAGRTKILDFGVARITDSDTEATRQTDMGQLVGTLAYMSPEQAFADPLELDTRSDIYTLGVILYELLAGKLPYDLSQKLHEAVVTIREKDPLALGSVNRVYRGDIEIVVAKAMEKDKSRRYASAADLAADIRRYLKQEPIQARPTSVGYQLYKFTRRNRALVVGAIAVMAVLVAGAVTSTWLAIRATQSQQAAEAAKHTAMVQRDRANQAMRQAEGDRERARRDMHRAVSAEGRERQERNAAIAAKRRADSESAEAKAINNFLEDDLLAQADAGKQSGPNNPPDPDLKVRTVLDRAAERIAGKFPNQPEVEASIRDTIGRTYSNLGVYPEARKQLEQALELRRKVLGNKDPRTLETAFKAGRVESKQGKYHEAEAIYGPALQIARATLGPEDHLALLGMAYMAESEGHLGKYEQAVELYRHALAVNTRKSGAENPDTLFCMSGLASVYEHHGDYAEAEALDLQTLAIERRVLGPEHPNTLVTMANLVLVYRDQKKYPEAEALGLKTLEMQRRVLGPENPHTLLTMDIIAFGAYIPEGKYGKAEALLSEALEVMRRVLGSDHPNTREALENLAGVYEDEGKYAQAELAFDQLLEIQRRVAGPERRVTLRTMNKLGWVYKLERRYAQAEEIYIQTLAIQRRVLGPEHPDTLWSMNNLGSVYANQGKYAQAEELCSQALAAKERVMGHENSSTLDSMNTLAFDVYLPEGKYAQAEKLLAEALEIRRRVTGPEQAETINVMDSLAAVYTREHDFAKADALYGQTLEIERRVLGDENPSTLESMSGLAHSYYLQGKYARAEELYNQTLAGRRRTLGPQHPNTLDTLAALAQVEQAQGKFDAGELLSREAVEALLGVFAPWCQKLF